MSPEEVTDRLAISDLLARYARAVDTRSWSDLDDIFTPDAEIDYTAMGGIRGGLAEVKAYLADAMGLFSSTQHMLGLPAIRIEGDRAEAVTPCHNPMVIDGRLLVCSLRYHHRLERTAGGWRISSLEEEKVHMGFVPGEES